MRLGIVGRGYWGDTYARTLRQLGFEFWQAGRDWKPEADGIIIACRSDAHFRVAYECLRKGIAVLIEKPVCLESAHVEQLIALGGVVLCGHTRLHDPDWPRFKAMKPYRIEAWAGGVTQSNPDPHWNWLPHLVAMCADLGFDPDSASFHITRERTPLRFAVNGIEFRDTHGSPQLTPTH